ncbi:hypothetical protein ABRZ04_13655 [Castellaniella ginsengisoli]|uniref:Uncharacterized protein n=1 Tax=Castellaniella ginsengisoli TaxID=546114 RepID=A0AB39CYB8_9BURK
MNIALPAIIAFLIILPGFAFRSRWQIVEGTRLDYSPFGQVVVNAVIYAALIHSIILAFSAVVFDRGVRFDVLIRLLSSSATPSDYELVHRDIAWVSAYFFAALFVPIMLAYAVKKIVSKFRLDRKDSRLCDIFRFKRAPWYYLLSGADFSKNKVPDFIQIAAVVCLGGQSYIYQGILEYYYPDEQGQLDRLVISSASRRLLSNDDAARLLPGRGEEFNRGVGVPKESSKRRRDVPKSRFYPILGDYFVLHYDEVVTLNVRYMKYTKVVDSVEENTAALYAS